MGYYVPSRAEMLAYLNGIARLAPYYMWGADMELITPTLIKAKRKKFGDSHYDGRGFEAKVGYYGCDCSGLLTPILGLDMTAQGWYNQCSKDCEVGKAASAPGYCLVFRGAPKNITHVGVHVGGKTWEMYDRCDVKSYDKAYWQLYGVLPGMESKTDCLSINGSSVKVLVKLGGYLTAADAVSGKNPAPATVVPGNYWVYKQVEGAVNITSSKGIPGCWVAIG